MLPRVIFRLIHRIRDGILEEFPYTVIADSNFASAYDPKTNILDELDDHFEDQRLHIERVRIKNPIGWLCDLGSIHQQLFISPHFF